MESLNLKLEKPIVFIKVHTTGINTNLNRIVQLTISRYNVDGSSKTGTRLFNPEMPIPEEATRINGITDDMVANQPTFHDISVNLHKFIGNADIAGFNVQFDLSFLMEEFYRSGLNFSCVDRDIIDLKTIYNEIAPRDFYQAAETFAGKKFLRGAPLNSETYSLGCVSILNGIVNQFKDKPITISDGSEKCFTNSVSSISESFGKGVGAVDLKGQLIKDDEGRIVMNFGKHKGKTLEEMAKTEMSYINWMTTSGTAPRDTVSIINNFIKKMNNVEA